MESRKPVPKGYSTESAIIQSGLTQYSSPHINAPLWPWSWPADRWWRCGCSSYCRMAWRSWLTKRFSPQIKG